jgi:hypothetical protein
MNQVNSTTNYFYDSSAFDAVSNYDHIVVNTNTTMNVNDNTITIVDDDTPMNVNDNTITNSNDITTTNVDDNIITNSNDNTTPNSINNDNFIVRIKNMFMMCAPPLTHITTYIGLGYVGHILHKKIVPTFFPHIFTKKTMISMFTILPISYYFYYFWYNKSIEMTYVPFIKYFGKIKYIYNEQKN